MELAVKTTKLCKEFGEGNNTVKILKNIDLSIEKGQFVSIMGASGSGKSTLLYLIGGLDNITSGSVEISGKDLAKMKDREKSRLRCEKIGFIFQFYNLISTLTVLENVLMPIILDNKKVKNNEEKANELLKTVGLGERAKYLPAELSGGQQQRVAIARALINDPEIILADEPIGNLDSKTGIGILELLKKINQEKSKTILMVTHSPESSKYANMKINIKDGEVWR